jgi:integrase
LAVEADIAKVKIPRHKRFLELFRCFVEFLLMTGLRREEALSLRTGDLDLERGVIHVYQAKVKQARAVPLHPRAVEILRGLGSSLFQSLNKHHVSRKFAHYLKQLKLQGFKLHSLRHTFATKLVSSGVDIFAVSRLLGHADIRTTLVYAKADLNVLHRAVMRINFADNNGMILVRGTTGEEGTS